MTNFELIVRPFQTRNVTPPTIIPQEPQEIVIPILLMGGEDDKTFKLDVALTTNVEVVNHPDYKEETRKSAVEVVKNPDDPNQHVNVERINEVVFQDKNANPMKVSVTDKVKFNYAAYKKQVGG